eukprot:jgi/Hompol1/6977/HPOL_005134-RA
MIRKEQFESANVQRLRAALNRSVYYYTFAEEWQQSESLRLQQDVRYLKAEASSLMAFLINSEEEKRGLHDQIEELNQVIRARDIKVINSEKTVEEMKVKLHDSFKEFLAMDNTMHRLRKEAQKGTEAAESRNSILQKNLDKLSADFEVSAKDLSAAQTKIRELEFELEELVQQFNLCGETKRKSEELNVKISGELDQTTKELKEAVESVNQLTLQKSKLEADLRLAEATADNSRKEQDERISKLTEAFDAGVVTRKELEMQLKMRTTDNEKLSNALKNMTKAKEQLETTAKATAQKHQIEISTRDARIR